MRAGDPRNGGRDREEGGGAAHSRSRFTPRSESVFSRGNPTRRPFRPAIQEFQSPARRRREVRVEVLRRLFVLVADIRGGSCSSPRTPENTLSSRASELRNEGRR